MEELDKAKLKKMINKWLKRDYYKIHREWPYKNIERKIVIEQFMEDNKEKDLKDYKFYCFNGIPKYIVVISDRFTDFHETYFDDKWNGFTKGDWQDEINVRNFIQTNYTPYTGDDSFLEEPTEKTKKL